MKSINKDRWTDDTCFVIPASSFKEKGTSDDIKRMSRVAQPKCIRKEIRNHPKWKYTTETVTAFSPIWKELEEYLWGPEKYDDF